MNGALLHRHVHAIESAHGSKALADIHQSQNLFESAYCAGARIGIGLSSASKPERMPTKARRAAETSSRPPRSLARPPQCDSQPKLRSTTQRRASPTKPLADGSRETTRWRMPCTFDHARQRSAANAPS